MSIDQNKKIARRFIEEVWNGRKLEVADELLAPDLISHDQPPGQTGNRESFKQYIQESFQQHPGLKLQIEDMIAEGDKVATRVTIRGGALAASQGTSANGIGIVRIVNGRIVEQWADTTAS